MSRILFTGGGVSSLGPHPEGRLRGLVGGSSGPHLGRGGCIPACNEADTPQQTATSYDDGMHSSYVIFVELIQNTTIEERVSLLEIQVVEIEEDLTGLDEDVGFLFDEQVIQDERLFSLEQKRHLGFFKN